MTLDGSCFCNRLLNQLSGDTNLQLKKILKTDNEYVNLLQEKDNACKVNCKEIPCVGKGRINHAKMTHDNRKQVSMHR